MNCPKCGTSNADGSRFCMNCGLDLSQLNAQPAQQPQPAAPAYQPQQSYQQPQQQAYQPQQGYQQPQQGGYQPQQGGYQPQGGYQQPGYQPQGGYQPQQAKTRKPIKINKKAVLIGGIAAAVIIVLIIVFSVLKNMASPDHVVETYVKALSKGDYQTAYNMLDLPESEMLTVNNFANCEEVTELSGIQRYNITEDIDVYDAYYAAVFGDNDTTSSTADALTKTYVVSYVTTGASYESTAYITLTKLGGHRYLFFESYGVSTSGMIASATIYAPIGSTVTLLPMSSNDGTGGVTLTASGQEDGYDLFDTGAVFSGDYRLVVTNPQYNDYEEEISLYYEGDYFYVYGSDMGINDSVQAQFDSMAMSALNTIWSGIMQSTPFDSLNFDVNITDEAREALKSDYENAIENVKIEDGYGLSSISFDSLDVEGTYISGNRVEVDYTLNYTLDRMYDGEHENDSSSDWENVYFETQDDGTWTIVSFPTGWIYWLY